MSRLTLLDPWWLVGALVLMGVAFLLQRRRTAPAVPLGFSGWLAGLPRSPRQRLLAWIGRSRWLALLLLAVVLSGPRASWQEVRDEPRGCDVLVVLDASSSMTIALGGTFASTRFASARAAIEEFMAGRPRDRVGLLTFARFPRLGCPLTFDHALFGALLDEAVPVNAGGDDDRTAIGVALAAGARELGGRAGRERLLVLVTDGANNVGPITPEDGARLCRADGIRVYAIALGDAKAFGSGAPPDAELLAAIAHATGGRCFAATDRAALLDAWQTIDALEQAPLERVQAARPFPVAGPLAVAALFLLWVGFAWTLAFGGRVP